ncbi:MAG: hypothetical protein AB8D52_03995 [Gammaproteobacteria bacterium]
MKTVQKFNSAYLQRCADLGADDILNFLEDFSNLHRQQPKSPSKLISIKIPENLLNTFRGKCQLEDVKYQTKIKQLMEDYLIQEMGQT